MREYAYRVTEKIMNMLRKSIKNIIDTWITIESSFVKQESHTKKRVLILRKDTLGDYILFYPSLIAYRKAYADAEITLVVTKLFRGLSPLLSNFEHIIWFDAKRFSTSFLYRRRFLLDLKKKGYDIAIQPTFSREPMGDLMMKFTEAFEIIGVDGDTTASTEEEKARNNTIYTKLVQVPESISEEINKNKYIAEAITANMIDLTFPTIPTSIFSSAGAEAILRTYDLPSKAYVIFFPGSGTTFKIWPSEKFAEVADYFAEKGITPVVCGGKGEQNLVQSIIEKTRHKDTMVNLCGKTDLPTMIHLLKQSQLYCGSDTGIAHLAAAIEVPVICIIGGGHFGRFFPYGNLAKNRIVFDKTMQCKNDNWACSKNIKEGESAPCIKNILVEDVEKEIDILIGSR